MKMLKIVVDNFELAIKIHSRKFESILLWTGCMPWSIVSPFLDSSVPDAPCEHLTLKLYFSTIREYNLLLIFV